jgi:hypothetical protein
VRLELDFQSHGCSPLPPVMRAIIAARFEWVPALFAPDARRWLLGRVPQSFPIEVNAW